MKPPRRLLGFTLTELMVVLAAIGVLTALAAPSFSNLIEKRRLTGATELVYSQMMFARNEAVKRSKPLVVTFAANDSTNWAFGITDRLGGCDASITNVQDEASCSIDFDNNDETDDRVLYRFTSEEFPGVALTAPRFGVAGASICATGLTTNETCFDPVRGTARSGSARFTTPSFAASTVLTALGRTRICTPQGAKEIPDYPKC